MDDVLVDTQTNNPSMQDGLYDEFILSTPVVVNASFKLNVTNSISSGYCSINQIIPIWGDAFYALPVSEPIKAYSKRIVSTASSAIITLTNNNVEDLSLTKVGVFQQGGI